MLTWSFALHDGQVKVSVSEAAACMIWLGWKRVEQLLG
jgi:hypothetical protein